MTSAPESGRAPSTIRLYEKTYASFEQRVRRADGLSRGSEVNPVRVAAFFNDNEAGWESKTARLYRAAIRYVLQMRQAHGDDTAAHALSVLSHEFDSEEDRIRRQDELVKARKASRKGRPRTSRQKVKRFSKEDAMLLIDALTKRRGVYGKMAALWFVAGSLSGLRPSEWQSARREVTPSMEWALVVRNAKSSYGRSHGKTRTILLAGLSVEQTRAIADHMENVRTYVDQGRFDHFYEMCRQCVKRAADDIWPHRQKHPSLYTARHMFAADVKTIFDKVEVAALMGHASIDTAGDNYAQRWSGSGGLGVSPSEDDVQAVASLNADRLAQEAAKAAREQSPDPSDPSSFGFPATALNLPDKSDSSGGSDPMSPNSGGGSSRMG